MTKGNICPECDRTIPENAPAGICPHCLLQAGLESPADEPTHIQTFEPPTVANLSELFDQLEIESLLGQGGMGAVYRARQIKLDRLVALKVLRPESSSNEAFAERFNREARTLARLAHPQIVGVHDFGELESSTEDDATQKLYYFLMEHIEGENLRQLMQSGPLSPDLAVSIVAQVCEALQYAHEEGVIHRDIKPENILIDGRGRVKIADFGLAKLATPSDQDFTLTATHQVMGTPRYMAPEQMAGSREVDQRADLYSLGVVFYEMLTGDIPAGRFSSPSDVSDLDPKFDDVIFRMLASRPDDRFQSAAQILEAMFASSEELTSSFVPLAHSRMGVSTIMERGVAAAWKWVRPTPASESSPHAETSPTSTHTSVIPMIIAALCLVALLLIPAPWMSISITDPDFVRGLTAEQITLQGSRQTYALVKSGMETWSGLGTMGALIGVIVSTFAFPSTGAASRWKPVVLTSISALALISAGAFWMEVQHLKLEYRYVPNPESRVFSLEKTLFHSISDLEHRANPQPVYLLCLGITGMVLLLSAREISRVGMNARSNSEPTDSWSSTPFVSQRFSVPSHADLGPKIVFHFLGMGYELQDELPGRWVFERGTAMGAMTQTDIREYPTKLTVLAVNQDDETQLVSCHWTVNLMGGWAGRSDKRLLEKEGDDLQELLAGPSRKSPQPTPDTENSESDSFEAEHEVSAPALAMIVFGILVIMGHLIMFIREMSNHYRQDHAWMWVPGLISGVLMLIGGFCMRRLGSLSWARIGVIGAALPTSPAWIINMFIAGWANQALQNTEVKAAFLENARRRRQLMDAPLDKTDADINLEAVDQEISGPSVSLMIFSVLSMIGHTLFFLILFVSDHEQEFSMICLPGMISSAFMFVSGWNFQRLHARGLTQFGLIIGMLPLNFAWLISIPLCIWTNIVFHRPGIKRAYLARQRTRSNLSRYLRQEKPGLRKR